MVELSSTLEQMCYATSGESERSVPLMFKKKEISKMIKWMELHLNALKEPSTSAEDLQSKHSIPLWERRFFHTLNNKQMLSLLNLANYLHVAALLDSGSTYISEKLTMKTVEEARAYLCQTNDFTSSEEREIQDRFGWLVEKF